MMRGEQLHLLEGPSVPLPDAFVEAWRRLEEVYCEPAAVLECIYDGMGWLVLAVDRRKVAVLCGPGSSDEERAALAWERVHGVTQ